MPRRCIALLSGGLDSMLAIRLMQEQGIEVEGVNFKTIFTCCQDEAGQAARELDITLTVVGQEEDYLDLIEKPSFGYGRGANPCVDCRVYMFRKAAKYMDEFGADFMVSGEVIGQRPKSQKKRDLEIISHHSDLDDRLLRPLSAKLLPATLPEREGWVDREKLYDFSGRSRKGLIDLAKQLGLQSIPAPSTGCALTEPRFSRKVFDLFKHTDRNDLWSFDLLKYGRHFRFDSNTKIVVGRNESDNESLRYMHEADHEPSTTLLSPQGFPGPRVLVIGTGYQNEEVLETAGALMLRYANGCETADPQVEMNDGVNTRLVSIQPTTNVDALETVATIN